MSGARITIIGGGSMQWAPPIVTDILLREELAGSTIVLHDIDEASAQLVRLYASRAAAELRVDASFRVDGSLERSLEGAEYIIVAISTGGLDAMRHDLAIPEKYDVYHTVGDTCGPGGWSRFVRNFPVFQRIARAIAKVAPTAVVLNYTNPMTLLTGVLARELENEVIGLCHGLFENLEFLQRVYDVEESALAVEYGGLNHFFWITAASIGGVDVLGDLLQRIAAGESLTALDEALPGAQGFGAFHSAHELATELFQLTGALPLLEDRHTCEFLSWTINDRERMDRYSLVRTSIQDRQDHQRQWTSEVRTAVKEGIPASRLQPTREGAAEIIAAHHSGGVYIDVGNLPNRGQVRELPDGLVVETAVRTDANGFTPLTAAPLPAAAVGLLAGPAASYQMLIDACFDRDRKGALNALRLEPAVAHLSTAQVASLADELLIANEPFGCILR